MQIPWAAYCSVFLVATITFGTAVSARNYGRPSDCPNCAAVTCLAVSEIKCKPPNYVDPTGDRCGCCPACIKNPDPQCPPKKCHHIRCKGVDEKKCKPPHFCIVPGDHCGCCPICVKRKGRKCPRRYY